MADGNELTDYERKRAQRSALLSQLFAVIASMVLAGQYMMLYANDVLGLSPQKIALIFALAPFASAFRLPIIPYVQRFGLVRTLVVARCAQVVVIVALIVIPAANTGWPLLAILIVLYVSFRELGMGTVWQPLMRHITTDDDRGRFFGGMRTYFTLVNLSFSGAIAWFIGQEMEEYQFKVILAVTAVGSLTAIFWSRGIPEPKVDHEIQIPSFGRAVRHVWLLLRRSRLFRLPLIITAIITLGQLPIAIVYFREALHVPAGILGGHIFCATLGQALSLILWGRISDSLGFRPMLAGLLWLTTGLMLILWLVKPFPVEEMSFSETMEVNGLSVVALMVIGFVGGLLNAGAGIATTSVMHYHVSSRDSLPNLNLFALFQILFQSVVLLVLGIFLQQVVIPGMEPVDTDGLFHFDWFKVYNAGFVPLCMLFAIPLVLRLPNVKPWFSINDFFAALRHSPWRSLMGARNLYAENEEERIELARSLGASKNPLNIGPLVELSKDPSYEVKVEAIRSLARTRSDFAVQQLVAILEDEEKRALWGHTAWALGELRSTNALPILERRLEVENPVRARAMAARAMGKIGAASSVGPLVESLKPSESHLHVVASACWALLKLQSYAHADEAFRGLLRLRAREERYEMLSIFSRWLGVTDRWILISDSRTTAYQSLADYLESFGAKWVESRKAIHDAFLQRDCRAISDLLKERAAAELSDRRRLVESLRKVMDETQEWSPLCVLAAVYLLFGEE